MENSLADRYYRWIEAWNGTDIDLGEIFHAEVIVRQMPHEHHGIDAVREMIAQGRAPFDPIQFRIDVEPIVENDRLAASGSARPRTRAACPVPPPNLEHRSCLAASISGASRMARSAIIG